MTIPGQAGLDNSPWITDLGENSLFKFDLASKGWKCYDIPEPKAHPKHVRVARDGTVWFWMVARNKLGRFRNGAFTSIDIQNENPNGLHVAQDQSLWYTTSDDDAAGPEARDGSDTARTAQAVRRPCRCSRSTLLPVK